jgi:lipoate---protein ligase
MKLLELTLEAAAENVALDEALLEAAEAGELDDDVLRLWEFPAPVVVVGRSSRVTEEVHLEAARTAGIPVLRRASGGAAIVAGPGCLMYSVVLKYEGREHLRMLDEVHRLVLGKVLSGVAPLVPGVKHVGTSDLAIAGRKFSGNSVRCKRDHLLYHGTLLYDFDLSLIGRLLKMPPRRPSYRGDRQHSDFVSNLGLSSAALRQALAAAFNAQQPFSPWPQERTRQFAGSRYSQDHWNLQR